MNPAKYVEEALVTESADPFLIGERLSQHQRLIHAGMGLCTEAAELVDALKKTVFYGKPLDKVNLKEEIGDIFWYCAIVADMCDFTFEDAMEANIKKLRARFPNKFTEADARNRRLDVEREILERG
jgi:NTP pyrophosphatase (non-canonical NTP hydrolase)